MTTSTLPRTAGDTDLDPAGTGPGTAQARTRRLGPRAGRTAALVALLAGTAVLYLWSLSASGYGNSFYAAAVQAGSQSWKAFFYGSLDAGNAITVDKPPASLWLMALSVRVFGLSSWSILAPQALLGVATVGVTYASVRRTLERSGSAVDAATGHRAGLVAGALLALTPAAALMFRFDNPDALLVFLLTLAAYVTLRATERAGGKTLAWAGVIVGFAFLTKMLQAFLVLPAFVLVYLVAAPTPLRRRVLHLLGAFAAMVASLGWWVAVVELVPASMRPFVGGSTNDSVLDLVFGYNGLARILGRSGSGTAGPGGGGGFGGFGGTPGITRLFDQVSAGMITWLLPAALLLAVVAVVAIGRAPRTDLRRAALVLWTGWTVVTGLTFSLMEGTYHDYYVVALAPAIAAGVALAATLLWNRRHTWLARGGLAVATALSAAWAFVLLGRATGVYETLRWPVLVVGLLATVGLLLAHRLPRVVARLALAVALAGAATGPTAYTLDTVATPHTGSIVTAGPVRSEGGPGGGFATRRDGQGQRDGGTTPGGGVPPQGQVPGQTQGQVPGQTQGQAGQAPTRGQGGPGGGMGGEASADTALVQLLQADAGSHRWAAATTGSQGAATYQLASGQPVMAIGGFTGSDPSPTLAQFQAFVAAGDVHYYVAGGGIGGGRGGRGTSAEISSWVQQHYTATTVGGVTVYDLTQPAS